MKTVLKKILQSQRIAVHNALYHGRFILRISTALLCIANIHWYIQEGNDKALDPVHSQYNTIQLYRLGVEGVQHILPKTNNVFSKGKCGLNPVMYFHEKIV